MLWDLNPSRYRLPGLTTLPPTLAREVKQLVENISSMGVSRAGRTLAVDTAHQLTFVVSDRDLEQLLRSCLSPKARKQLRSDLDRLVQKKPKQFRARCDAARQAAAAMKASSRFTALLSEYMMQTTSAVPAAAAHGYSSSSGSSSGGGVFTNNDMLLRVLGLICEDPGRVRPLSDFPEAVATGIIRLISHISADYYDPNKLKDPGDALQLLAQLLPSCELAERIERAVPVAHSGTLYGVRTHLYNRFKLLRKDGQYSALLKEAASAAAASYWL
jgi:hypothetical protein